MTRFLSAPAAARDFRDFYRTAEPALVRCWPRQPEAGALDPELARRAGQELRLARESLNLSPANLSTLTGIPVMRLQAWEHGGIRTTRGLRKVARLVGKLHETRVLCGSHVAEGTTSEVLSAHCPAQPDPYGGRDELSNRHPLPKIR